MWGVFGWAIRAAISSAFWRGLQLLLDRYELIPQIKWVVFVLEPSELTREVILWSWAIGLGIVTLIIFWVTQIPRWNRRRTRVNDFRQMIADVIDNLDSIRVAGSRGPEAAKTLLERHPTYAVYEVAWKKHSNSGLRRLRKSFLTRLRRFGPTRELANKYLPITTPPERTMVVGSTILTILIQTKERIAKIEEWWGVGD